MAEPTELWTRERWAAVATYAEQVNEILSEAINKIEKIRAWDGDEDHPENPGLVPSANEFIAPYHEKVTKALDGMRHVLVLLGEIPELPTGDKIIRDSEGKPVGWIPRKKK